METTMHSSDRQTDMTDTDMTDEEITPYDGATELDQEGHLQPVADADEDDDPEALAGEELLDEEDAP